MNERLPAWRRLRRRFWYLVTRGVLGAVRALPDPAGRGLCRQLALTGLHLRTRERSRARGNLALVCPDRSPAWREDLLRRSAVALGETLHATLTVILAEHCHTGRVRQRNVLGLHVLANEPERNRFRGRASDSRMLADRLPRSIIAVGRVVVGAGNALQPVDRLCIENAGQAYPSVRAQVRQTLRRHPLGPMGGDETVVRLHTLSGHYVAIFVPFGCPNHRIVDIAALGWRALLVDTTEIAALGDEQRMVMLRGVDLDDALCKLFGFGQGSLLPLSAY